MSNFLSLRIGLALTAGLIFVSATRAQTSVTWVKDINTTPLTMRSPSRPSPGRYSPKDRRQPWVKMGSYFYFQAQNATSGLELFRSNGTTATLVKDIEPGARSSSPSYLTLVGSKLYFSARSSDKGYELWMTDGTAAGTKMVKDAGLGRLSGYAMYLAVQDGWLYYYGYTAAAGFEMHRSDGTATSTGLYWDMAAGTASTYPGMMTPVGSRRLYFQGRSGLGVEPMFLDVTNKTKMVFDANPTGSSYPSNSSGGRYGFAVDNGSVYASAVPVYGDYQLLKISNGATAQSIGRVQKSSVFSATDPRVGQNMTLEGSTAAKNPLSVIILGDPDSTPQSLFSSVPGGYAYFEMGRSYFIVGTLAGATYRTVQRVPNDTGFLGREAVMQVFSLDTLAFPAKMEVSNGVHITFGK